MQKWEFILIGCTYKRRERIKNASLRIIHFLDVMIGVIDSFHKKFAVVNFVRHCVSQKVFKPCRFGGAKHHCVHVVFFPDFTPIHAFF